MERFSESAGATIGIGSVYFRASSSCWLRQATPRVRSMRSRRRAFSSPAAARLIRRSNSVADGKLVGYDIDMADEIARRMGVNVALGKDRFQGHRRRADGRSGWMC